MFAINLRGKSKFELLIIFTSGLQYKQSSLFEGVVYSTRIQSLDHICERFSCRSKFLKFDLCFIQICICSKVNNKVLVLNNLYRESKNRFRIMFAIGLSVNGKVRNLHQLCLTWHQTNMLFTQAHPLQPRD